MGKLDAMLLYQQTELKKQEAEQAVIRQAQHDAAAAAGMNQVPGAPAGAQGMTL